MQTSSHSQKQQRHKLKRKDHEYNVNDAVLVENEQSTKFGQDTCNGPCIFEVCNNITIKIQEGPITDTYNI